MKTILKWVVIASTLLILVFIALFFLKIGFVYWFYRATFDFVTGKLGLEHYGAVFVSLGLTACFSVSLPYLAWSFFAGRRYLIPIGATLAAGLMWGSVHTLGIVNFDPRTRESNKWVAETPEGKVYCYGPGCSYEHKYGQPFVKVTPAMAMKEAQETRERKEQSVREQLKREEALRLEEHQREEREARIRLEQIALERERESKERAAMELERTRAARRQEELAAQREMERQQQERMRQEEAEKQRQMARQREIERDIQRQVERQQREMERDAQRRQWHEERARRAQMQRQEQAQRILYRSLDRLLYRAMR